MVKPTKDQRDGLQYFGCRACLDNNIAVEDLLFKVGLHKDTVILTCPNHPGTPSKLQLFTHWVDLFDDAYAVGKGPKDWKDT